MPRFDLETLRPFEVMFADNKDYPAEAELSCTAFVLVDVKSNARFKMDVPRKTFNGMAFRRLIAMNGVHKLPYKCTVYADNCGSMVHVMNTCVSMGLNFQPLPPKGQSLNLAYFAL